MADDDVRAVQVLIHGRVQGVGFRYHTAHEAMSRGVGGWVRNQANGSVEAWFEGAADSVQQMIDYANRGPGAALVAYVDVRERTPEGRVSFHIRS